MTIYFVDGDNFPKARLVGTRLLAETDIVYIFHNSNSPFFNSDEHMNMVKYSTRAKVEFVRVEQGKNSSDFAIAICAAKLLSINKNLKIKLISADGDFCTIRNNLIAQFEYPDVVVNESIYESIVNDASTISSLSAVQQIMIKELGDRLGESLFDRIKQLLTDEFEENNKCTDYIPRNDLMNEIMCTLSMLSSTVYTIN